MQPDPSVWAVAAAGAMVLSLLVYTLTGGADFGGGVWDLLASGPRKHRQREVIAHALAPIWEANHVWLIVVVVLLFVCFPPAFATIGIALHIPLVLALIGIVLRGAAFVFRAYDPHRDDQTRGPWRRVFAISSTITPVMLGISFAAVTTGALALDPNGAPAGGYLRPWLAPFPLAVGLLVLALDALLAAVYLVVEVDDADLKADFRRRGLAAGVAVGVLAGATLLLAADHAPVIHDGLTARDWSLGLHLATAAAAIGALAAIATRRDHVARVLVVLQVSGIVLGWAASQWPWLILPDLDIGNAAAPDSVLRPVMLTLLVGAALVLPAFAWLYRVFKGSILVGGD